MALLLELGAGALWLIAKGLALGAASDVRMRRGAVVCALLLAVPPLVLLVSRLIHR